MKLGVSNYLRSLEAILDMLILRFNSSSSALSSLVSFFLLRNFPTGHSSFLLEGNCLTLGSTNGSGSVNSKVLRLADNYS
jgi:hypothetical protein